MDPSLETTECPFCFGNVPIKALKCKHCGEWIQPKTLHSVTETGGNQRPPKLKTQNKVLSGGSDHKPESEQPAKIDKPPFPRVFSFIAIIICLIAFIAHISNDSVVRSLLAAIDCIIWIYASIKLKPWPFILNSVVMFISAIAGTIALATNNLFGTEFTFYVICIFVGAILSYVAGKQAQSYTAAQMKNIIYPPRDPSLIIKPGYKECPRCHQVSPEIVYKCPTCETIIGVL